MAEGYQYSPLWMKTVPVMPPTALSTSHAEAVAAPLLEMRGLQVVAGERVLLHQIDLTVQPGEIITLMGPNGAGKTTLLRTICGTMPIQGGMLQRRSDLRIGYVPQHMLPPSTMPLKVHRFLRMGQDNAPTEAAIQHVLQRVKGERLMDKPLHMLSGGEKQRILLARAMLRKPNLLLLDEPMQGVDIAGQVEFYQQLQQIKDELGCAVVLVSHDLHWVMAASDRVLCINGHICCTGRPEDVKEHPEFVQLFGEAATRQLALYSHHHDHQHRLDGQCQKEQ